MSINLIAVLVLGQGFAITLALGWTLRRYFDMKQQQDGAKFILGSLSQVFGTFVSFAAAKQADMATHKAYDTKSELDKELSALKSEWTELFRKTFEDLRSEIKNLKTGQQPPLR